MFTITVFIMAGIGVHHRLESVFMLDRNDRSRWAGIRSDDGFLLGKIHVHLTSDTEVSFQINTGPSRSWTGFQPRPWTINRSRKIGSRFEEETTAELSQYRVVMETSKGNILIEMFPDKAPNHVRHFLRLTSTGVYDKTAFHRIAPGFVIQAGDLNTRSEPVPQAA